MSTETGQLQYVESAEDVRPLRALPYDKLPNGSWQAVLYAAHLGPTGLQTSVLDMERWARNFYFPKVGDRALIEQMQLGGSLRDGSPVQFAFGLERKRIGDQDVVLHTGVTVGTRSAFARFLEKKKTVVLLCNRMDVNTERVIGRIAMELFKRDP